MAPTRLSECGRNRVANELADTRFATPYSGGMEAEITPKYLVRNVLHLLEEEGFRRWYYTFHKRPRAGVNPEQRMRELEECQWWLACIANWMHPIIPTADQEIASQNVIGCSSGESLPLPPQPSDILGWINSCMEQIDWQVLTSRDKLQTNSLPGLQHLLTSISRLQSENIIFETEDFYEVLEGLSSSTEIPSMRSGDKGIKILSPSQAYGLETEYLILCGIDAETWSMKPPQIPWLDEANRMTPPSP